MVWPALSPLGPPSVRGHTSQSHDRSCAQSASPRSSTVNRSLIHLFPYWKILSGDPCLFESPSRDRLLSTSLGGMYPLVFCGPNSSPESGPPLGVFWFPVSHDFTGGSFLCGERFYSSPLPSCRTASLRVLSGFLNEVLFFPAVLVAPGFPGTGASPVFCKVGAAMHGKAEVAPEGNFPSIFSFDSRVWDCFVDLMIPFKVLASSFSFFSTLFPRLGYSLPPAFLSYRTHSCLL